MIEHCNGDISSVKKVFASDNLIYNRFDLIHPSSILLHYLDEDYEYDISLYMQGYSAYINVWGKILPQKIFETMIDEIFNSYREIKRISVIRGGNGYLDFLQEVNDIYIEIPRSIEELLARLKSKHQYNLRRMKRILQDRIGAYRTIWYTRTNIPNVCVELYFKWKKASHGIDYGMSVDEYLDQYYVTNALELNISGECMGIAFCCCVEDVVYLENFSFNPRLKDYSIGFLTYELLLEQLILQNKKLLFLGGGEYDYKKRFNAVERAAYSGNIYRQSVIDAINKMFATFGIKSIAIYGLGHYGKEFIYLKNKFDVELVYGIDKCESMIRDIPTYMLEDELPDVDAVIVTLNKRYKEVDSFLQGKFNKIYYYKELLFCEDGDFC